MRLGGWSQIGFHVPAATENSAATAAIAGPQPRDHAEKSVILQGFGDGTTLAAALA